MRILCDCNAEKVLTTAPGVGRNAGNDHRHQHHYFLLCAGLSEVPPASSLGESDLFCLSFSGLDGASQPGRPDSWELESSMGLSPGSLGVSLSHQAVVFQDSWIHPIDVYPTLDLVLRTRFHDESISSQGPLCEGEASLETESEDSVGK